MTSGRSDLVCEGFTSALLLCGDGLPSLRLFEPAPMVLMRPFRLASAALIAGSSLITSTGLLAPVRADTVARANGRCLLRQDGYEAFNGHCTVKQKQNGGTTIFVVDLDNGSRYRFSGPNRQQLQVETPSGLQANVLFQDQGSKGLFSGPMVPAPTGWPSRPMWSPIRTPSSMIIPAPRLARPWPRRPSAPC